MGTKSSLRAGALVAGLAVIGGSFGGIIRLPGSLWAADR